MVKYALLRLCYAFLTLLFLLIIVYLLAGSFSRHPFSDLTPEQANEFYVLNGLDRPVLERFGNYLKGIFVDGNFGKIYNPKGGEVGSSIPEYFFSSVKWSILITVPALIISSLIGLSLGVIAGYNRGTWIDTAINVFVALFMGLPSFVLAPIMILIAVSSNGAIIFDFIHPDVDGWWLTLKSLALPIVTVSLGSLASYTLLARNQVITILSSNHILIARSKGLSEKEIFTKHMIRNISIPILNYLLPSFLFLLTGNILIEQFFRVPGASSVVINSFPNGEINVVMFSIWFFSGISLLIQIILDLLCVAIDPRIRFVKTETVDIFTRIRYAIVRFINEKKEKKQVAIITKVDKKGVANE